METIKLPLQRLEAEFAASEANRESRTVPMTFYTGAKVLQFSWENGEYFLTLSLKPGAVRLGELNSGRAPFTIGHASSNDPTATIGVISNARIEGKKAKADVRFSKRAEVGPIFEDILDGITPNVSVGARLYKLEETTAEDDKKKSFLATDWEPFAVALVGIGADSGAHFAAPENAEYECEVEFVVRATSPKEQTMDKPIDNAGEQARTDETKQPPVAVADEQLNAAHKAGETAEQARIAGIMKVGEICGCELSFIKRHISENTSLENFRKFAIDDQAQRAARLPNQRGVHVDILRDESDTRRASMTGALLERFQPGMWSFDDRARSFRFHRNGGQALYEGSRNYSSCTLLDVAKECLAAQHIMWQTKTRTEIAQLAFQGTSDFPFILANVAGKSLRAGYEMVPSQWRLISARRTAADFKTQRELTLDASARLERVPESGEFKRGRLVEGQETYALSTYGKVIAITRQAIINDDLGAFTRTPQLMGQEVAMLEADTVWAIVTANGNLRDGVALFAAAVTRGSTVAGNLVTGPGTVINTANLGIARVLMMTQQSTGGKTLGIVPRYLVAPAAISQVAEQYTSPNFVATTPANINTEAARLTPITEPRLDAADNNAWYLFADPNTPNGTVLIYAYLEGQEGPYTETRNGFDVDGVEIKIRHDFAAAAVDFRGAVKNDGA